MADSPSPYEQAKRAIAKQHLEQLKNLPLGRTPPVGTIPDSPIPPNWGIFLKLLEEWTTANQSVITDAVNNREFGGPFESPINWKYTFLAFMQSMAMYLRDWNLVVEATEAYKEDRVDEAIQKLEDSVKDIQTLANMWNMDFQQICDLKHEHSQEHWLWNGPFAGLFISKNADAPFMSVGFKGTDPTVIWDWIVNLHYKPQMPAEGILYNTEISEGVYNGLWGTFPSGVAFDMIKAAIATHGQVIQNTTNGPVVTHSTGHSLGGSYSTLCYNQFTQPNGLPDGAIVGDMYTFGAPRVGLEAFAKAAAGALNPNTGSSWRVVNKGDGVPMVPPVLSKDPAFNHVNVGWMISPDAPPEQLPTEIGTSPKAHGLPTATEWFYHLPTEYCKSLEKALSS